MCGHATCSNCKTYCGPKTHKCYMLPVEAKGGACTRDTPCTAPKKCWRLLVFVLRYCIDNAIKLFCTYNGTKIMYMAVEKYNVRFVDSINFVSAALETFPKTFGFSELKKGYFPHLFNTPENQAYVGSIPPKYYYDPDHMKPSKCDAFLTWYDQRIAENYLFNFKNELQSYCRSDIDILRPGMMLFPENFLKIANIDPLQYVTIASVCMAVYRSKYMSQDRIGIIKDVPKNTSSKTWLQWLRWVSETQNVYVQHAMNGGEHFIPTLGMVDGFCKKTNTVYEFQGCFWHGCPRCYTKTALIPSTNAVCLSCNEPPNEKTNVYAVSGTRSSKYTNVIWEKSLKSGLKRTVFRS